MLWIGIFYFLAEAIRAPLSCCGIAYTLQLAETLSEWLKISVTQRADLGNERIAGIRETPPPP